MIDSSARERFAAVHLSGSLEAAVYKTLASVPSLDWTRTELAAHLRADVALVHVVLRQFAAAGVVDALSADSDTRYQWRPISRFLGERPTRDAVRDPVCGMWVTRSTPFTLDTDGGTEHFCSQRCLLRRQNERADNDRSTV